VSSPLLCSAPPDLGFDTRRNDLESARESLQITDDTFDTLSSLAHTPTEPIRRGPLELGRAHPCVDLGGEAAEAGGASAQAPRLGTHRHWVPEPVRSSHGGLGLSFVYEPAWRSASWRRCTSVLASWRAV
jgi:hypothetical protein